MARNLTLALDEDLIRKARVLAANRGTSVSGLVRMQLEKLVREDLAFETARTAALARLGSPADLGGGPLPGREELHERDELR